MRKTLKSRIMAVLIIAVLAVSLIGCGAGKTDTAAQTEETEKTEELTEAEKTEAAAEEVTETEEETAAEETAAAAEEEKTTAAAGTNEAFKGIPTAEKSDLIEVRSVELLESAGVLAVQEEYGDYYKLYDADMELIADDGYIYFDDNSGFVTFAKEDGINTMGLMDAEGTVVMPAEYGVVEVYNDRWAGGTVLEETDDDAGCDYRSFNGKYYLIVNTDIYYKGNKVAGFDRSEAETVHAFGDFLHVSDRDGKAHFYDKDLKEAEPRSEYISSEYYAGNEGEIWHLGSGTEAFTEGCTLTSDQVKTDVYNKKGELLDLQGNVRASTAGFASVGSFINGYATTHDSTGKLGLIRSDGQLISECVYEDINMYEDDIPSGYVPGVLDGKFCIISLSDGSAMTTEYTENVMKAPYAPFASKVNDDGTYTLFSGPYGELDGRYDDVSVNIDGRPVVRVISGDSCGVIDLAGNYVIEPDGTYKGIYDLTISKDSTVIVGKAEDGYYVYKLSY